MGISNPSAPAGRPVTRPSVAQRPNAPSTPENRPSLGNTSRPSVSPPGIATRPAPRPSPGGDRPGIGERPGIGGNRPGTSDRPQIGGNRPGTADRPGIGPNRPGTGDRPVIGNRPGGGNRPIVGGGNTIVNRPGGGNVNIANINNRPGWGLGSAGHGHWADHWYGHHVPSHYHGWYHGCWSGNWGRYWYAPVVAGATAWGLSAVLPSWGYSYGSTYSNPYYVESAAPVYDYSQPIAINTYDTSATDASADLTSAPQAVPEAPAPESPQTAEAYQFFDQALAAFKKGDYPGALQLVQQALRKSPQDPVMHEVSALCLFALGDYGGAAAVLNNLLAVAPGMDWTTLSGLYGNVEAYTTQLRALEAYCKHKPDDAAGHFLLAYHYLVAGHDDAAAAQLKRVIAVQPGDQVASRMLAALVPPTESTTEPTQPAATAPAQAGPTTDLVGNWQAERNGDAFQLSIDENNQFAWKAVPKGKPPITLAGTLAVTGDAILLQSKDQGTMVAQVKSDGTDQFQFIAAGSPPDDKGLSFQRVK
jgi:tetratricopeptide (TPR) repeat protein